jgi:hypothetical protein
MKTLLAALTKYKHGHICSSWYCINWLLGTLYNHGWTTVGSLSLSAWMIAIIYLNHLLCGLNHHFSSQLSSDICAYFAGSALIWSDESPQVETEKRNIQEHDKFMCKDERCKSGWRSPAILRHQGYCCLLICSLSSLNALTIYSQMQKNLGRHPP